MKMTTGELAGFVRVSIRGRGSHNITSLREKEKKQRRKGKSAQITAR